MKQITFEKDDPSMGSISGILRIKGKICYFKYEQSAQAQAMMERLQASGAIITPGRKWIRVNLFGENKDVKLGNEEFNVDDKTEEEIEDILNKFFGEKYVQAGFIVDFKEINSDDAEESAPSDVSDEKTNS